jgi:DEP domain-containing protein 5
LPSRKRDQRKEVEAARTFHQIPYEMVSSPRMNHRQVTVWVHDDSFSKDEVLLAPDVFGDNIRPGALLEMVVLKPSAGPRDSRNTVAAVSKGSETATIRSASKTTNWYAEHPGPQSVAPEIPAQNGAFEVDPRTRYCFIAKPMPSDIRASHPTLQISITSNIANTFGYRQRPQALISLANRRACSASHVELIFRDEYLSRSDMWRLVRSELAGKTVYKGQKILFLGTIKAMVKTIYVGGRTVSSAYFRESTVPVFRSESARYVLFIQMSREMWDFDSEGTGEIMFSRVIDGFLPELFKKWVELEARHLVSIVLFGRLEYDHHALAALQRLNTNESDGPSINIDEGATYRDFYRVVVTDMASGQWTTILNELKKDFRVFLRDISLHQPRDHNNGGYTESETDRKTRTRICGQPTSALRGNILEAVNIASSQYASDYIDRDLVRTGISIIVITAGTGVFEVDHQLLDLTSESLTNNGIGIDLVCLSRMPLHSVPLFKWRRSPQKIGISTSYTSLSVESPPILQPVDSDAPAKALPSPPSYGSLPQSTPRRKSSATTTEAQWSFGIPQWIDVSYWTSSGQRRRGGRRERPQDTSQFYLNPMYSKTFVPRVRMYELQMMGVMELGLANISIPYLSEGRQSNGNNRNRGDGILEHHRYKAAQLGPPATSPLATATRRKSNSAHSANRGRGLLSAQAKQQGDMYERMDAYDKNLFSLSPIVRAAKSSMTNRQKSIHDASSKQNPHWQSSKEQGLVMRQSDQSDTDTIRSIAGAKGMKFQASGLQFKSVKANSIPNPSDSRISRAISFALRGLGPSAPRAFASTEINVENVQAEHSISNLQTNSARGDSSKSLRSPGNKRSKRLSLLSVDSESTEPSDSGRSTQKTTISPSRPISIKNTANPNQDIDHKSRQEVGSTTGAQDVQKWAHRQNSPVQVEKSKASVTSDVGDAELRDDTAISARLADTSPWIKNVNPANPNKNHPKAASWVGRWQHLYPRTPKTSTVKWKSLCTPASVPLTTDEFPSRGELEHDFTQTSYTVTQKDDSELAELPRYRTWLLLEMIGLRLSHGYQIVVGRMVAKVIGSAAAASADYFTPETLARDGVQVFLSMGNTIQRLCCVNDTDVEVTRFVRKPPEANQERLQSITYNPVIRTILSTSYSLRTMTLAGFSEEYSWNLADSHIATRTDDLTKVYEELRFWRARFVVIPVEPPPSARRPIQSMSEDNEEEIHLLGIRELTKMWQKIRYTPPDERRFRPTTGKRKDPNPLEIVFQTLNSSEVVATEIEKLIATDEGAESKQIQLLPDSELLERSTSSVAKIAQVLQSDKGVEIANRRWHLRLHYSCFKGDDFTNWLISSFKDIDSREEAVDFGNELMQHGLFHHVSTRHTFKDGNYFYTIAPEHRVSRPESRSSWFPGGRRSDRSVPATPIAESGSHVSPLSSQSQPGWNSARQFDNRASERVNGEKRQVSVSLTKMMRIDVDHRNPKRSDRPEIVNLHYDRLHNPENCYHLELSWFNVTSKLIEDAIVTWATQSEKYGLRLVEVPIAEACCITDREPFRAPYRIQLKVPPPPSGNVVVGNGPSFFTNTSFAAQTPPSADKLIYHKEILKKFNFVLDLEAASEFPPDVDVTYTWGKLGYRYPQFVHRSGVIIAQITDDGELFLLANRLYNTRSASVKDAAGKFETKHNAHSRPPPASGIVGLNAQNPSPHPSPLVRASSDVLGSRDALNSSGMAAFITPEQIKYELEDFCHNAEKLKVFYKEVSERGPPMPKKSGSSSSSVLRPVPEYGLDSSIPDLRLPASVVTTATTVAKSLGVGSTKRTSPQLVGRDRATPETAIADSSRRTSTDSH